MFFLYPFFIASHSLLNIGGIYPIWLFINIYNFGTQIFKGNVSIYPYLFYLPFISLISYLLNLNQSKLGHLIAYFIIFVFVITSFVNYFYKRSKNQKEFLIKLRGFLRIICTTLFISSVIDYVLLFNNIDYSDFIPADLNYAIRNNFYSRARGFWNEPTDLCLATNSFFSIYLGTSNYLSSFFKNKFRIFSFSNILIIFQWITILIISRSAAAIGSLIIAMVLIFIYKILFNKKNFFVKKSSLIIVFSSIPILLLASILFSGPLRDNFNDVLTKLTFNPENISVSDRVSGWLFLIDKFNNTSLIEFLFGFGPGNVSLSSQLYGTEGSLSWILSLLLDLGVIGLASFLLILIKLSTYFRFIPIFIRPFYFISLITTLVHLCTQTGFYLPSLSFVLSVPIIFYKLRKTKLSEYKWEIIQ